MISCLERSCGIRSYVIFICTFDAFGKGESVYTFENMCKEVEGLPLGDETHKIFLNAKGVSENVSPELKAFLQYVSGTKNNDPFVRKLDEAVEKAKKNVEWRREYMTLLMRDKENMEKGWEEGRKEGLAEGFEKNKIETVISMHENGISKPLIAKVTGFSEEKIDEILNGTFMMV